MAVKIFKKTKLMLAAVICLALSNSLFADSLYWRDYAKPTGYFTDQYVSVLRYLNGVLYLSTGTKQYAQVIGETPKDITDKFDRKEIRDAWGLQVDEKSNLLYLNVDTSSLSAKCYTQQFELIPCSGSDYLKEKKRALETIERDPPQSSSLQVWESDETHAAVGFFKGNIYLLDFKSSSYSLIYKTTNIYNWPTDVAIDKGFIFASTRGDGLIVYNRMTGKVRRYHDKKYPDYINSITTDGTYLYIGLKGVYRIKLDDIR